MTTVLIVDDSDGFRRSARLLLEDDGFDVAEALAARSNPPLVVMVSTRSASTYAARLAATPARGFIAKADLSGETLAAMIG